jgi:hypothetical protein
VHAAISAAFQRGEEVWDPSKPRIAPNLVSDWQSRPMVVYDIAQDGTTGEFAATLFCFDVAAAM